MVRNTANQPRAEIFSMGVFFLFIFFNYFYIGTYSYRSFNSKISYRAGWALAIEMIIGLKVTNLTDTVIFSLPRIIFFSYPNFLFRC